MIKEYFSMQSQLIDCRYFIMHWPKDMSVAEGDEIKAVIDLQWKQAMRLAAKREQEAIEAYAITQALSQRAAE